VDPVTILTNIYKEVLLVFQGPGIRDRQHLLSLSWNICMWSLKTTMVLGSSSLLHEKSIWIERKWEGRETEREQERERETERERDLNIF
jgi:hypothetical protein